MSLLVPNIAGPESRRSLRAGSIMSSPLVGTIIGVLVIAALWHAAAQLHRLIPTPAQALDSVARAWDSGTLTGHVAWTLSITVQGFLIAAAIGVTVGLTLGLVPAAKAVLGDMVYSASSVPKLVVFPILLVLLGLGRVPETLFVALSGVFLITIQVMTGCSDIQPVHRRVGRVFRARSDQVLLKIILPAVAPGMATGLRLGFSMGLVHAVLAEMALGSDGVGYLIWTAYRNLDMGLLFGLVFITSVFAVAINLGFYYLEKRLRGGAAIVLG